MGMFELVPVFVRCNISKPEICAHVHDFQPRLCESGNEVDRRAMRDRGKDKVAVGGDVVELWFGELEVGKRAEVRMNSVDDFAVILL